MRMLLGAILLATAFAHFAQSQDGEIMVPLDNKTQCINDMVQWCDSMQYPQQGAGMALLSMSYEEYRVFCSSDSDGTNCTQNRKPWFSCSPDHTFTYKGQILSSNVSTDVDDDICKTADKAFNELLVQNLSYYNTTLKEELQKGLEAFFEQMARMQEEIDSIQKRLNSIPFFNSNFWDGLFDDIQHQGTDITTTIPNDDKQNSTEQMNMIEGE